MTNEQFQINFPEIWAIFTHHCCLTIKIVGMSTPMFCYIPMFFWSCPICCSLIISSYIPRWFASYTPACFYDSSLPSNIQYDLKHIWGPNSIESNYIEHISQTPIQSVFGNKHITKIQIISIGGIPTPLKNMSSSVGIIIPKIFFPNHQPDNIHWLKIFTATRLQLEMQPPCGRPVAWAMALWMASFHLASFKMLGEKGGFFRETIGISWWLWGKTRKTRI